MELEESDFISLIHFTGERAELKTKLPPNVMTNGVLDFIKEHQEIKLSDIKIKKLNERLSDKRLKACLSTAIKYIDNVKTKQEKTRKANEIQKLSILCSKCTKI